ncbi:MAG TPA: hypothetical protein VFV85_01220 [Conexibacter sp.]|nr:hypothetical protein [Conexibacter sp.]
MSEHAQYVAARRVLLDALTALGDHGPAVIVAGAQAVYLRTGSAELAIAPYTTDGDLAIDPSLLEASPELARAMREADFTLSEEPGIWVTRTIVGGEEFKVPVDLIVPEQVAAPGGRRDARLPGQERRAARRVQGLEAALVDHAPMTIGALDRTESRSVVAEVAGEAALLVAKAHKLDDRVHGPRPSRADDKDAADVVRLMRATDPHAVGRTLVRVRADPVAQEACVRGVRMLDALFGRAGRPGVRMAQRALRLAMPEELVEALCVAYVRQLVVVAG